MKEFWNIQEHNFKFNVLLALHRDIFLKYNPTGCTNYF